MKQIIQDIVPPSTKIILALDCKLGDGLVEERFETTAGFLAAADCGSCEAFDGVCSFGQRSVFERIKLRIMEIRQALAEEADDPRPHCLTSEAFAESTWASLAHYEKRAIRNIHRTGNYQQD